MTRCTLCYRRIWPWQHFGFITLADGLPQSRWHTACGKVMS